MTQTQFTIRPATINDVPDIFALIQALAEYEKLADKVTGNVETLQEDLFGADPCIEAIVAEMDSHQVVGFALFFTRPVGKQKQCTEQISLPRPFSSSI